MLRGSCMCGKVQYRIEAKPLAMYYCHCSICRAASGAGFSTNVAVSTPSFEVTAGAVSLIAYESSPPLLLELRVPDLQPRSEYQRLRVSALWHAARRSWPSPKFPHLRCFQGSMGEHHG